MATDLAPFVGTVGGGFLVGFITGYAIKKVMKIAAIIVGLFIAAIAYLQYQRIINVDWERVQAFSQNGIDWVADACFKYYRHDSFRNISKLVSSVSAGFAVGFVRG